MPSAAPSPTPQPIWSLVLAGGEGTRLHARTRRHDGVAVPKQFFPLLEGAQTPLESTLARLAPLTPARNTVVVVSEHHRPYWAPLVRARVADHWLIQPHSRGTGLAALLGLLHIQAENPDALVVITPADHGIRRPDHWNRALARATTWAAAGRATLIGVPGDTLDDAYGWIVPTEPFGSDIAQVGTFVEKPEPMIARALRESGALVSTFVVAGRVADLLGLFESAVPWLLALARTQFVGPYTWLPRRIAQFLEHIPAVDFSADVLANVPRRLLVLRAAECGWSDLGTPERLDEHLQNDRECSHARSVNAGLDWLGRDALQPA